MDPSTSSFTTMDMYNGVLEDPISLHKYLFANSNPLKYRDPSGHKVSAGSTYSIEEMDLVTALMSILSGVDYTSSLFGAFELVAWGVGTIYVLNSIKKLIVLNELLSSTTISSDVGDIVIGQDVPLDYAIPQETVEEKIKDVAKTAERLKKEYKHPLHKHHIVAKKDPRAHESRIILSKSGYWSPRKLDNAEVDCSDNYVFLKAAMHYSLHSDAYHIWVFESLDEAFGESGNLAERHLAVKKALFKIRFQLETWNDLFPDIAVG